VIPPTESTAVLPLPALNDQRWTSPVADSSSVFIVAAICAWVLAKFQMRSSSTRPMNGRFSVPSAARATPRIETSVELIALVDQTVAAPVAGVPPFK
jgi:hypothetical protein